GLAELARLRGAHSCKLKTNFRDLLDVEIGWKVDERARGFFQSQAITPSRRFMLRVLFFSDPMQAISILQPTERGIWTETTEPSSVAGKRRSGRPDWSKISCSRARSIVMWKECCPSTVNAGASARAPRRRTSNPASWLASAAVVKCCGFSSTVTTTLSEII